jgi:hypothetical protein
VEQASHSDTKEKKIMLFIFLSAVIVFTLGIALLSGSGIDSGH